MFIRTSNGDDMSMCLDTDKVIGRQGIKVTGGGVEEWEI